MGCGCNKRRPARPNRPTVSPNNLRPVANRPTEGVLSQLKVAEGISKQEREEERKRRIQAIIKKKKFQ
jgi:hypothetical protein